MKRSELLKSLKILNYTLAGESQPEIFQCFCFDGATVYSYNDKVMLSTASGIDSFVGAVNGKALLGSLDASEVEEVEILGNDPLVLKLGKAEVKLPILPKDQFASLAVPDTFSYNITEFGQISDIIEALEIAELSLDSKGWVGLIQEGDQTVVYSTDTVSISRIVLIQSLGLKEPVTLSYEFVTQFLTLAKKLEVKEINFSVTASKATFPDYIMIGRNLETPKIELLQKYTTLAHQTASKFPPIPIPTNLSQILASALVVATNDNTVRLTVDKDLLISNKTYRGQFKESIEIEPHPAVDIKVNTKKLIAGLKTPCISLQINELFINILGDNFDYLVAPYAVE
jgi:hypothetical protein